MINISDNKLILMEEYIDDIIILTSYFSLDFDKNLLESFEKYIHNKIKSLILQSTPETIVREKYVKKIEECKEDIKNFQIGCRKLKRMLSELQNEMIKIRQRDDSEYEEEYMRRQKIIFRKFFNKNQRIKEIIRYNDSIDLFKLSFLEKKKNEDNWKKRLNNEEKEMKRKLKKLKKSDPDDVISINFQRPFTYPNFLIALLTNSGLNIKISKVKPYKDSEGNPERYFKMMIKFNSKEVYSNLFSFLKIKQFDEINFSDPSSFDFEHFLLVNIKKDNLNEKIDSFKKYIQNFIEYKQIKSKLGFKLNFNRLMNEIWRDYIDKSSNKESSKKAKPPKRNKKSLHTPSILTVIGVFFAVVLIVLAFLFYSPKAVVIEKYDGVKIHYSVWESNEHKTYDIFNPLFNKSAQVNVISINDTSVETTEPGLILGLYNNLLGKELFYESEFIWLNRCLDEDCDGYDDITGQPALTFGNSFHQYFNTCLVIKFKVLSIQKTGGIKS